MRKNAFGWLLASVLLLAGCTTVRPLESAPPGSVLTLSAPMTIKGLLTKATFPPGDYKPTLEDKGGYYYQAPAKVVVNDIVTYMYDGGLYIPKGSRVPSDYYVIKNSGQTVKGRVGTLPPFELKD